MKPVILITGATSGIGRECALRMSQEPVKLFLTGRSIEKSKTLLAEIDASIPKAEIVFFRADVCNTEELRLLIAEVETIFGRLDGVLNNAGIVGPVKSFLDYAPEEFNLVMNTNLNSVRLLMQLQISLMLKNNGGRIVNMASTSGLIGNGFGMSAYATSKFALVGLSKAVALEFAKQNIRVNTVCPGFVDTPMLDELYKIKPKFKKRFVQAHPIGRLVTPQEIAEQVYYLLCAKAADCITGQAIVLDGGLSV